MIYCIELWNAKPTWKVLPKVDKQHYVNAVIEATSDLANKGVQVITWSENTTSYPKKADFDYFAIWTIPTKELAGEFLNTVEEAGWYNYFEQSNILGNDNSAPEILDRMVQLS